MPHWRVVLGRVYIVRLDFLLSDYPVVFLLCTLSGIHEDTGLSPELKVEFIELNVSVNLAVIF